MLNKFLQSLDLFDWGMVFLSLSFFFFIVGFLARRKNSIRAEKGSVVIGNDNFAPINIDYSSSPTDSHSMTLWNILAGIASFVGLALTILSLE